MSSTTYTFKGKKMLYPKGMGIVQPKKNHEMRVLPLIVPYTKKSKSRQSQEDCLT
jgi:hypothetical protein